ncbi:MAG: thiamine pyrophosphate-binding protein [Thermaerobacter sp.]|nr:thiamine pyrophosphate-binding protein [Thermaerobacter sp.]
MQGQTGAELLVRSLIHNGVRTLFGFPGDTGMALYSALRQQSSELRHVLARDERSAAIMADVYARVSGDVGVVEASSGGGATYLVGGLGESYAASVPVLVITSDIPQKSHDTGAITEIDQVKLFSAVTKWQAVVRNAGEIPALVAEALSRAREGRPGPVSLVLSQDVLEVTVEIATEIPLASPRQRSGVHPKLAQTAAQKIMEAKRPAIIAGSGVHWAGAWESLKRLAEWADAPTATTIHGKGAFPEDHALALGVSGGNGARDYTNHYLEAADVVLLVGTRANATDTNGYTAPSRTGCQVIHIDIDPHCAGRNFPDGLALVGDAETVLAQVATYAEQDPPAHRAEVRSWLAHHRSIWLSRNQGTASAVATLEPARIITCIAAAVGPDAIVLGEPGTPTPYLAAYWESGPGRQVLIPRGHGIMGFALGGAVGAALARPDRRVVAITTDGSLGMAAGELETARRLELPIIFIHLRNESLGWIKMLQHLYMDRHYFGVDFSPVDAVKVAIGFGVPARAVETLRSLESALGEALANKGPFFVDVPVPEEKEVVPPVAPWLARLAGAEVRSSY